MTSACSRWSQPPKAAISNWNGSTVAVYAMAADPLVGHYAVAGTATMVVGAYRAVQETDLKRILAYSTLSALGVLTMLLRVGTRDALVAALVYLVAHAAYKGALFMVAGAIEHEVGTRDISTLAGLRLAGSLRASDSISNLLPAGSYQRAVGDDTRLRPQSRT